MASLYEIDERLKALEEFNVDLETGEIIDELDFYAKLDEIQMALSDKIENTMAFYKNLMSDVEAFKNEEKKLAERRKAKENLAQRLKSRIDNYITYQFTDEVGNIDTVGLNAWKMETPKVKLSYRKSESVNITDMDIIPKKFIKKKVELSADKTEIKKALKEGQKIKGAELETNYNMQVK